MKTEQKNFWHRTALIVKEVGMVALLACVLWCVNLYLKG